MHRKKPWDTRGIPSVGRASDPRSSMSAGCGRAMKPGRRRVRGSSRAGMDPARLLAARLQERVADVASRGAMSAPCRDQQWCRCDPSKARMQGRQSEGERKMTTRDSLSRRNGTHCNTTGRARLSRALPLNSPPIRGEARALVRVTDTDSSPDSAPAPATVRHARQTGKKSCPKSTL